MDKSKTPWVDYRTLKKQVSILDVARHFGIELATKDDVQFFGPCPIPDHGGDRSNTQAFSVNTSMNCWRCFSHCGSGNVIDLYCRMSGSDPQDRTAFRAAAVEMHRLFLVRTDSGSDTPPPTEKRCNPSPEPKEKSTEADPPTTNPPIKIELKVKRDIPFLMEEKRIPDELLAEFGIGWCSKGMHSGRVVVPIHNRAGERIAYAGRGLTENDIQKRGRWLFPKDFRKSLELFNQHRAVELLRTHPELPLIVVEGFWSVLRFHEAGIPCVGLMGSEMSDPQLEAVVSLSPKIQLMLDDDEAGTQGTEKILSRLCLRTWARVTPYPPDDPRSQPEDFTTDELRELIRP